MTGMLAESKAGHDKNKIYVIMKEETEYVYLVDGKIRTLAKPKKKNKKHIQIIKKGSWPDLAKRIQVGQTDDIEIRKVIKQYQTDVKFETKVSNIELMSTETDKRCINENRR